MKIHFYIRYNTRFGQTLWISGNCAELGDDNPEKACLLTYMNEEFWQGAFEIDPAQCPSLSYTYILKNDEGHTTLEWANDRVLELPSRGTKEMAVVDSWNYAGFAENTFYTAPFQHVLLPKRKSKSAQKLPRSFTHEFRVKAPLLAPDEVVCLCGSTPSLGSWQTEDSILMQQQGSWWVARVNFTGQEFPIAYKYGIFQQEKQQFLQFEGGNNRVLYDTLSKGRKTILHDGFARFSHTNWRGTGLAIPVFSLRSKNSFGVGEFTDLKLLADWAAATGLKLIQLLPVNDTTATHSLADSYPYAAISAFALHPMYLNLEKVAGKKDADLVSPLRKKQKQLNKQAEIDYEQVMKFKLSAARELFEANKTAFLKDQDFLAFFNRNRDWLEPYAAFCYLRDDNGTAHFLDWKTHRVFDKDLIERFVQPGTKYYHRIALHYFIQYHLHLQLQEAVAYAHKLGIIIKGDIPIGVYRFGCDAWQQPGLYHMELQAGAPPDDFAVKGQNWGFPTYNWQAMREDGYAWWRRRFEQMSDYFDAFRIDHILGFFRIWSIPMDAVEGILGRFVPAIPVSRSEFSEKGIWLDDERYCQPYINDSVLWEKFGQEADYVKKTYLDPAGNGRYTLKPELDSQRKVEAWFDALEDSEENEGWKNALYDLISNVILFKDAAPDQFHFRIGMEQTISFRHLEWEQQNKLKELYVNYFYRRQDDFWSREAMQKLPELKRATNMLICGEDLGMVPHCVPEVMEQLGILSLEIQRMPKKTGAEFFHPQDAPYLSVVTPSTHDMSTIRGWWEEDRAKTNRFFNQILGESGEAPVYCEDWVNKAIILQHLYSPAMWSIFQLQDILGMSATLRRENPMEERINIPADPKHYWRYRMHIGLEELIKATDFNEELKNHVVQSGRG